MRLKHWKATAFLAVSIVSQTEAGFLNFGRDASSTGPQNKTQFIESLISEMTLEDLGRPWKGEWTIQELTLTVLQLHLMFADDIVGAASHNELYGMILSR